MNKILLVGRIWYSHRIEKKGILLSFPEYFKTEMGSSYGRIVTLVYHPGQGKRRQRKVFPTDERTWSLQRTEFSFRNSKNKRRGKYTHRKKVQVLQLSHDRDRQVKPLQDNPLTTCVHTFVVQRSGFPITNTSRPLILSRNGPNPETDGKDLSVFNPYYGILPSTEDWKPVWSGP